MIPLRKLCGDGIDHAPRVLVTGANRDRVSLDFTS
jgi:hypothetical protein